MWSAARRRYKGRAQDRGHTDSEGAQCQRTRITLTHIGHNNMYNMYKKQQSEPTHGQETAVWTGVSGGRAAGV
jgi:phosphoribosyl 1,2-cyclic phosphodiesterase